MKKWLLIGLVLVLALSGVLVGCSCEKNGEEQPTGVIRIGDYNVKVVEDLPENLKLVSIRLERGDILSSFVGTFKNVSDQTITFKAIFILDEERVAIFPLPTRANPILEPDEEVEFKANIVGCPKEPKLLKVELESFNILGGPSETTPEEPIEPEEPTKPEMTPEEVLMKWLDLMKRGEFSEAEKLITPDYKKHLDSYGGLKKIWQENPMTEVEILRTQFETKTAIVYVVITFEDGTVWDNDTRFRFEKINNEWEIDDIS